jgi:transposase-like protein
LRNSFKYASKKDWAVIVADLKPVYTPPSEQAALDAFAEFSEKWEKKYPAIIRLWTNAWGVCMPGYSGPRRNAGIFRSPQLMTRHCATWPVPAVGEH